MGQKRWRQLRNTYKAVTSFLGISKESNNIVRAPWMVGALLIGGEERGGVQI